MEVGKTKSGGFMLRTKLYIGVGLLLICSMVSVSAQQAAPAAANAVVPPVVKFIGVLTDTNNKPLTGTVGVTFSLYQQSQGGAPLWVETQNVIADKTGGYTVMLGSSTSQGLPSEVFNSGEARWLGVQAQGQAEQLRTVLISVPYALKAADAETVGGLPASAFLKAAESGSATGNSASQAVAGITGGGKANYITKWLSATKLGNSNIFDSAGNVGIATTSPGATLDVNGSAIVEDNATVNGNLGAGNVTASTISASSSSNTIVGTTTNPGSQVAAITGNASATGEGGSWGVLGTSSTSAGAGTVGLATGEQASGVYANNTNANGGYGVYALAAGGIAVQGEADGPGSGGSFLNYSTGDALFAYNQSGTYAGFFEGNVDVDGNLSKAGGSFKIDHPLDPANKYLYHSFVESPDMMNIYNGNATTDAQGSAVVTLPEWFETLNRDFRYQLTVMGQFAQAIVASRVANHQFTIKTDKPHVEVSWQVTGIRQDAWANAHRIPVEVAKAPADRGLYLHPELFGAPPEKSIALAHHPMVQKLLKQQAAK
jgi:hypothetical protein